jgi:membrane-associated protease RseP (regulator of RpoE activity)
MEEVLARPRGRFPALNVALFLLTVATTIWAGFGLSPLARDAHTLRNVIEGGLPFAATLVGILFTHEMGHYVLARRHRVDSTLPYFIPFPGGVGTFGAVIRIRSMMPSRKATLDIGAAGPFAGFVLAVPLLLVGLSLSEVKAVGLPPASDRIESGLDLLRILVSGVQAGGDVQILGDSALTWLAQRAMFGALPPGHEIFLHPVAFAAWLGLFVTALNLVPMGQLDGGHVLYALFGRRGAERASRLVSTALLLCGVFVSFSWFVWWAVTRLVVGVRHPPAMVEEPLGRRRRALAVLALVLFALTFVPVPVSF